MGCRNKLTAEPVPCMAVAALRPAPARFVAELLAPRVVAAVRLVLDPMRSAVAPYRPSHGRIQLYRCTYDPLTQQVLDVQLVPNSKPVRVPSPSVKDFLPLGAHGIDGSALVLRGRV